MRLRLGKNIKPRQTDTLLKWEVASTIKIFDWSYWLEYKLISPNRTDVRTIRLCQKKWYTFHHKGGVPSVYVIVGLQPSIVFLWPINTSVRFANTDMCSRNGNKFNLSVQATTCLR